MRFSHLRKIDLRFSYLDRQWIVFRSVVIDCGAITREPLLRSSYKNKRFKRILFTDEFWFMERVKSISQATLRNKSSADRQEPFTWNRPSFIRSLFAQINFIFRCRAAGWCVHIDKQLTHLGCVLFLACKNSYANRGNLLHL